MFQNLIVSFGQQYANDAISMQRGELGNDDKGG